MAGILHVSSVTLLSTAAGSWSMGAPTTACLSNWLDSIVVECLLSLAPSPPCRGVSQVRDKLDEFGGHTSVVPVNVCVGSLPPSAFGTPSLPDIST